MDNKHLLLDQKQSLVVAQHGGRAAFFSNFCNGICRGTCIFPFFTPNR